MTICDRRPTPVLMALFALFWQPATLPAQSTESEMLEPSPSAITYDEQSGEYQPPVIQFDATGLSLGDALRLTLQHDPNIMLQEATADFQAGVSQEQSGVFDATLKGGFAHEYREQELPESRKQIERDKRNNLSRGIEENRQNQQMANDLADALAAAANSPTDAGLVENIPDPFIRTQIEIIDALIRDLEPGDARDELLAIREDFLRSQIPELRDGARQIADEIATAEQRLADLGEAPDDEWFRNTRGNVEVSKLFRNGISMGPFFDANMDDTNFKGKPKSEDFGGKGLEPLYTFRVGFNVVVPLARGRGKDATGAGEEAALIEYEASLSSLQHESALSVLATAQAYWRARGAERAVEISQASVDLQERLVQLTQQRVDAGELAQVELARVQASEARARARLSNAEQSLIEARVALAVAMGVRATDDDATLPRARDPFPSVPDRAILDDQEVIVLASAAVDRRQDLMAARLFEDSGIVLTRAAETDLRPVFNVIGSVWGTALDEVSASNALDRWAGPSGSIQLGFEKPFGNNLYKGRLLQREADLRRRSITATDLARLIELSIVRSARSLEQSAERVRQAERAVDSYQRTVDAEFQRFTSGDSTLIDAILTEDQQLQAQQSLIGAQQEFAQLLAALRFETGRLVTHSDMGSEVNEADLLTIPTSGGSR